MIRLHIVCEGLTEITFIRDVLQPHLSEIKGDHVALMTPNLKGQFSYTRLRKEIRTLLGSLAQDLRVTTMIDFYKLPSDFPSLGEAASDDEDPMDRVGRLEAAFSTFRSECTVA